MDGMRGRRVTELLAVPVTHNGIALGHAVDALLDLAAGRALGLEVHCGDDVRRFLPLGAATLGRDATEVGSPLALLDDPAIYRSRGTAFRELRGTEVRRGEAVLGTLEDVFVAEDATIASMLVTTPAGQVRVPFGPSVSLSGRRKASAA
jgi:hypothetical protein